MRANRNRCGTWPPWRSACISSRCRRRAGRQREGDRALSRDDLRSHVQSGIISQSIAAKILWSEKRGTKNVSLEGCDLGLGAGKLEGAFAQLPRYFADADKVMDLEQRLLWCMQNVQGLDTKDVIARRFSGPGRASDMEDLVAFIANKSNGMKIDVQLSHPKEQEMAAVGEELFFRRGGVMDFSCATCHADEGKRIRLQGLPNLSKPGKPRRRPWRPGRPTASRKAPCARCSTGCGTAIASNAGRCRNIASDSLTALTVFLNKQAPGGEINVPSIKR